MREIILKSISASPEGVRLPGGHSVPAKEAEDLVKTNHAEYADAPPPVRTADPTPSETATIGPAEKRAVRSKK